MSVENPGFISYKNINTVLAESVGAIQYPPLFRRFISCSQLRALFLRREISNMFRFINSSMAWSMVLHGDV
jgi:hypothetical protein